MRDVRGIVFAGDTEIGRAILSPRDPSMGVYGGRFVPALAYEVAAPAMRRLTAFMLGEAAREGSIEDAYRARDELDLRVRTEDGLELHPQAVVIWDATDFLPDEELVLELLGVPWDEAGRISTAWEWDAALERLREAGRWEPVRPSCEAVSLAAARLRTDPRIGAVLLQVSHATLVITVPGRTRRVGLSWDGEGHYEVSFVVAGFAFEECRSVSEDDVVETVVDYLDRARG